MGFLKDFLYHTIVFAIIEFLGFVHLLLHNFRLLILDILNHFRHLRHLSQTGDFKSF